MSVSQASETEKMQMKISSDKQSKNGKFFSALFLLNLQFIDISTIILLNIQQNQIAI